MRIFGIWLFGILACANIGGAVGSRFDDIGTGGLMMIFGVLGGVFTFACARLWIGSAQKSG
jgi:hypothetical protein